MICGAALPRAFMSRALSPRGVFKASGSLNETTEETPYRLKGTGFSFNEEQE
jgi:hypothetical protein